MAFFCLIFSLAMGSTFAQDSSNECMSSAPNGFISLKSYNIEQSIDDVEHSYVFSKDTDYMLVTCNGKDLAHYHVIVSLYDSDNRKIASNYNEDKNIFYPAIVYTCKKTGIYYLKYSFQENKVRDDKNYVSVLSFKK